MKCKLDENLGAEVARILRGAGHDVTTVRDQDLGGVSDNVLYDVCRRERRCLITLDLDFSNVLRFSPEPTAGIVILRPPGRVLLPAIMALTKVFLEALKRELVNGRLWIVEPGRIRVHQQSADED
jgi:predicted nuclease of predicted toxin-antitoxin system